MNKILRRLKFIILFICVSFIQELRAQMFTTAYQAVNYQKVFSNGINFDGTDDYISLSRPVSDDFTIEFWMKTTQTGASGPHWYYGRGIIDAESPSGANDFGTALVGNKLAFGTGNPDYTIVSNTIVNDGIWKHVAATRTKATGAIKIYINGVLDNSGTSTNVSSLTAPTDIKIGKIQTSTNYFNGTLDDIRIWNYERTALQILGGMNTELVGYESGLVVYYNCNQGTSNGTNTGITTINNEVSATSFNGGLYGFALTGQTSNWVVGKLEPLVPTNNLKLYVDAGKPRSYSGSGSVMTDLSPSGNNMTLYNSPTYSSSNGGNLSFNGSNNYLTSVSNSPITGASPRTVCVWYNPTSIVNNYGSLFWTGNLSTYYAAYGIGFNGGKYQFWGQTNDYTDANLAPNLNSWNFIAAAYGGGNTIYQYLNGTGNLNTLGNTLNTPAAQFMFASNNGTGFAGKLGNIMVFDRMLSKQELDKLYNSMKLRVPDGSSAQNAAVSGLQLHIDYPSFASGWYWIKSPTMPNALQMYVDKTEDGGGYDFYPITAGPSVSTVNVDNGGTPLGLDIVYPRSKNHWKSMSNAVNSAIATSRAGGAGYASFFQTTYGVYRVGTADNGANGGNYTMKIMRSAEYGGTTNAPDWKVKDGGMWWLSDATYGEPNGDYGDYGFLGGGGLSNPYSLTNLTFNDLSSNYPTGNYYLVSTNAKKGVVYDNSLLLYVDPSIAGSYSSGTIVSDLSPNLNNGTLSSVSYVNTATTPKKFTFNGTAGSNISFATSKFNTTYTGKTIIVAAKLSSSFGTNYHRVLFGSTGGNRNFNFYIYQNGTNYLLHFSAGGTGGYSSALPITTDQWYVFAVTHDATNTVSYYLNGNLVGTNTGISFSQYLSNTNENIGLSDTNWLGDIGTTMIYKRGLTAAEIMQNYLAIKATYY